MTTFKANRKFPNPITVTDDPKSHTLALQQVIEALNIGQRRTKEVQSSYVRVHELVDVGLIEVVGNQLKLTNLGQAVAAGGATTLAALTDVDLTGLADGDVLVWNSGTSRWEPGTASGASALADLTDVDLTGLADGDTLIYDSGTLTWTPATPSGGGASATLEDEILADSPSGYWKCEYNTVGGGTLLDSSGNGYDSTSGNMSSANFDTPLVPSTPNTLYLRVPTGSGYYELPSTPFGTAPLTGDWTMECVVVPCVIGANSVRILTFSGIGETEAANYQFYLNLSTSGELSMFWEYGAGANLNVPSSILLEEGTRYHVAMIKDGTADTIAFYINGVLVATVAYSFEPSGGGSAFVRVGSDGTGTTNGFIVGHIAFYNGVKLDSTRIMAHYAAINGGGTTLMTYALDDLTDVDAAAPSDGDVLTWDTGTMTWRPEAPAVEIQSYFAGRPADSQVMLYWHATKLLIIPGDFAGAYGYCRVNPTATVTLNVAINGSNFGTISISTGGVFTFATTSGAQQGFSPGDRLSITNQATSDLTAADIGVTLVGVLA
jgi:hypothetical protein